MAVHYKEMIKLKIIEIVLCYEKLKLTEKWENFYLYLVNLK